MNFIFFDIDPNDIRQTLEALFHALDQFHANEDLLVELEARVHG